MTTDVPSPLVPKLRFPEFRITGDWKRDQIGNIASISKGKGVSKGPCCINHRTSAEYPYP